MYKLKHHIASSWWHQMLHVAISEKHANCSLHCVSSNWPWSDRREASSMIKLTYELRVLIGWSGLYIYDIQIYKMYMYICSWTYIPMYTCTVDPRNKVVELDMQCMLNIFRDYHPRCCEFNQFSKYSKYTPVCALFSSLWCKMRVPY